MKVFKSILSPVLVLSMLLTACQTGPIPSPTVLTLAPLISSTTAGAIIIGAEQDPKAVQYAQLAGAVIKSAISTNNLAPAYIQAQLDAIRIQGLNPQVQALIVAGLVGIYESFAQQAAANGVNSNADLATILNAIVTGIDQGVAASTSMPPVPGTTKLSPVNRHKCVADWYRWRSAHPNLK